jgi:alkanesulfonate monooxygenase SsuD/methylene tetrahydromethanopterin reductase-like flavin-dependent oxidoreductase (luciferase family)
MGDSMTEWRFIIKRTDLGEVTVTADTEEEARAKARDYADRIIQVNNQPWHDMRHIKENLIEVIEGSN